jgi:hypothetical protein
MERVNTSGRTIELAPAHSANTNTVVAILLALFIALCAGASVHRQAPPEVASSEAPPETFSSGRAMKHLAAIARKPHPMGSSEHAAVRDYIMKELSASGLEPELQHTIGINRVARPLRIGAVENVLARLKGATDGKSVLLVAHYDSTPNSFGASDNGSAVAVLLETVRALRTAPALEPALKNDVVFLFSDGEESGLLGAEAFVSEHAWAKNVGVALNFDARGNSGPTIMFETSDDNGWLIREFARAAPFPVAHSLSYEIYKLLPNDTDLTVFKKAGFPGLNFAYINGLSHYHTLLDNVGEVDERSLQHQGSYALGLTRHLGELDLTQAKERNAVYFDLFGVVLVHYSTLWVIPLAVFTIALFIALVLIGVKRGRLTLRGIAWGGAALLLSILVSSLTTTLLWKGVGWLRGGAGLTPGAAQSDLFLISFVALAVAVTSAILALIRNRASIESLATGGMVWWLILAVAASFYLPGGSFLFIWPLCFSLIGLGWMILAKERGRELISFRLLIPLSLCAAPGIILLVPTIYQIFVGLTLDWTAMIIVMVGLLLWLLIPCLQLIAAPRKWLLPGVSAMASLILLVIGSLMYVDGAHNPRRNSVFYGLNADTGKAVWASDGARPDEWTSQFFSGGAEKGTLPDFVYANSSRLFLKGSAPVAPMPAPQLELLEDHTVDGARTMRMRLYSPRQAAVLSVYIDSKTEVLGAAVNNKPVEIGDAHDQTPVSRERRNQWGIRMSGFPQQGIELQLKIKASGPLKIRLVDQSYGLPQMNEVTFKPRPPSLIPSPAVYTDSTFLSKSFVF